MAKYSINSISPASGKMLKMYFNAITSLTMKAITVRCVPWIFVNIVQTSDKSCVYWENIANNHIFFLDLYRCLHITKISSLILVAKMLSNHFYNHLESKNLSKLVNWSRCNTVSPENYYFLETIKWLSVPLQLENTLT